MGDLGCPKRRTGTDTDTVSRWGRAPEGKEAIYSPGPWERDEQEQVWEKRKGKKRNIPARDLGKKLPKGAAEDEGWRQHGKGLGEQAGQAMLGGSWVGSGHRLLKSPSASFPTQTINYKAVRR